MIACRRTEQREKLVELAATKCGAGPDAGQRADPPGGRADHLARSRRSRELLGPCARSTRIEALRYFQHRAALNRSDPWSYYERRKALQKSDYRKFKIKTVEPGRTINASHAGGADAGVSPTDLPKKAEHKEQRKESGAGIRQFYQVPGSAPDGRRTRTGQYREGSAGGAATCPFRSAVW